MEPLWRLKQRGRKLYRGYHAELDHFSCGIQLAEHLSPRLAEMGRQLDAIVEEIKEREQEASAS